MRHVYRVSGAVAASVALGWAAAHAQSNDESERDAREDVAVLDDDVREQRIDEDTDQDLAARRSELVRMADQALVELRRDNSTAAELMGRAFGHAVFNVMKGGLLLTGAGGTGIARPHEVDEIVFMRLGSAGIGLGAGFESYKLILLFENENTYANFISGQWDGALSAQAAAGTEGASAEEQFIGGIRAFRLTDGGLMAQVDVTGVRVWPARRLNEAAEVEARVAAARSGQPEADTQQTEPRVAAAEPQSEPERPRPERLDELMAERDDLDTFVEAVKAAGLADALTGETAYTVFAPTNEAFESSSGLPPAELLAPENRDELIRLLRAHIVADDLDRSTASEILEARTIDGGTVSVDVEGDRFTVGDAAVLEPDIRTGNLRIHVVDGVLGAPTRLALAEEVIDVEAEDAGATDEADAEATDEAQRAIAEAERDIEDVQQQVEEGGEEVGEAIENAPQ